MDFLEPLLIKKLVSYYRLHSEYAPQLQIYCVSTPFSRNILNRPEVRGVEFTRQLRQAVTMALEFFPEKGRFTQLDPETISVVHFLRSGLNFGLRDAIYDAWGFNTHLSSFMTSQRARDQFGRWYIKDDQYRKIEIPAGATLIVGEIVATGVTVENGLEVIYNLAKNLAKPVRNLAFITIGCHKIEKALQKYDSRLRSSFPDYGKTYLIYLEGKFHLADSKTEARLKIQGTDLMRHPALLAPEFELSQFQKVSTLLERCVIYDGGSRAFNVPCYLEDVRSYWEKLLRLGERGWTLLEALSERWPAQEYRLSFPSFAAAKRKRWHKVDQDLCRRLYRTWRKRWTKDFEKRAASSQALIELCQRRLRQLPSEER